MIPRFFIILFLSTLTVNAYNQSPGDKFTKQEIQDDLAYLYTSLKDAHYDLFAYATEEKMDSVYHYLLESINKDSFSALDANKTFQHLIASANNGHTELDFPIASYRQYAFNGGTLFPLEVAFEGSKNLVRKNYSGNEEIPIGAEIISINGEPINAVLDKIYPFISAERLYFKKAKLEVYSLPRMYWLVYGQQDKFEVEIRSNEEISTYTLNAVNLIEDFEHSRTEILNAQMDLRFYSSTAYLNPGNFSGDEPKFQRFIDSAFTVIKEQESKNLIIDLRNNQGGNDSFSDYMIAYIANRPFRWNSSFTLKTSRFLKEHTRKNSDTTSLYFQEILKQKEGTIYPYDHKEYQPQPTSKRFKGKVYVLVNRQSHSQSTLAAAQIQDYNFGTIVGEETAESGSLYASQFHYTLPNTNILVKVSKGYMVRVNGSTKLEGVIPDIKIKDYLLDEKDEIMEGLLEQIQAK